MKVLLIAYDNDSYVSSFPLGLAYLASSLRKAGHEVLIYNQDVYHWPESHLQLYLTENSFDVVGVGACGGYYQYQKVGKIAKAINAVPNKPYFILGGHLVSPEPEFFLDSFGADVIVIGAGEQTIVEVVDSLGQSKPLSEINGIAFKQNGSFVKTEKRAAVTDVDSIPFPAWDLFPMDHYTLTREPHIRTSQRCMYVLSGRGCPFRCNFCYRMDEGFRPRSNDAIIEEVEMLKSNYGVSYIYFVDELLMGSVARTISLCESFIKAKLNINWNCNGRLNFAQKDLLKLMKEAGCVFINYGIESLDEEALIRMNKKLTVKQIVDGIENTLAVGISPGFNIIFGNHGETKESLRKGVEFLLKYDDQAQLRTIRPVTPYPGSDLYYYALKHGMIKNIEDFYHKNVNSDLLTVNFTDLSDDDFHEALFEANKRLLENYHEKVCLKSIQAFKNLYINHDSSFRGLRHR